MVAKYHPDIEKNWIKIKNGTNLGPNQLEHGFYVSIKIYIDILNKESWNIKTKKVRQIIN